MLLLVREKKCLLCCCVLVAEVAAANMDSGRHLMQEELNELKTTFTLNSGGVEPCGAWLERNLHEWETIALNVAVIGNSGVGKSSFINAVPDVTLIRQINE